MTFTFITVKDKRESNNRLIYSRKARTPGSPNSNSMSELPLISTEPVQPKPRLVLAKSAVLQVVAAVFAHDCVHAEKLAPYSDCPLYVWVLQRKPERDLSNEAKEPKGELQQRSTEEAGPKFVYVRIRKPESKSNRFKQHHIATLLLNPKWDTLNRTFLLGGAQKGRFWSLSVFAA